MKRVTGVCTAVVLVLSGCAMVEQRDGPPRPPVNCGPGACQVEITVAACDRISANKDPIVVASGHSGPIQWRLDTRSGWEFTRGGIVIHQGAANEFVPTGNSASVVTWHNNHRTTQTYKYDVVVMKSSSGQVCRWDPSIMN